MPAASSMNMEPKHTPYQTNAAPFEDAQDDGDTADNIGSDSGSIIGVSIGRTQTYLASPTVSSAQKSAFLGTANDGSLPDRTQHTQEVADAGYRPQGVPRRPGIEPHALPARSPSLSISNRASQSRPRTSITLPSPWRAGPNQAWNVRGEEQETFASMMQRLTRPRASSGPGPGDESGWRRYIPSRPKTAVLPRSMLNTSPRSASPTRLRIVSNPRQAQAPNHGQLQRIEHDVGSDTTLRTQSAEMSNNHSSASSSTLLNHSER